MFSCKTEEATCVSYLSQDFAVHIDTAIQACSECVLHVNVVPLQLILFSLSGTQLHSGDW
jgi:hypothetical protein